MSTVDQINDFFGDHIGVDLNDIPNPKELLESMRDSLPNIDFSDPEALQSAIEGAMDTIGHNAGEIYGEAQELIWKVIWSYGALSPENVEEVFQNLQQATGTQIEGLKNLIPDDAVNQFSTEIEKVQDFAKEQAEWILHGIKELIPESLSGALSDLSETLTPFIPSIAGLGWAAVGIPYLGLAAVSTIAGVALVKKMRAPKEPALEPIIA